MLLLVLLIDQGIAGSYVYSILIGFWCLICEELLMPLTCMGPLHYFLYSVYFLYPECNSHKVSFPSKFVAKKRGPGLAG